MTDNEIIKALECCSNADCVNCPKWSEEWYSGMCSDFLPMVLDLINRQRAEIERLQDEIEEKNNTITFLKDQAVGWSIDFCNLKKKVETTKAEAIKEFVERLKSEIEFSDTITKVERHIDNLVKEMTEGEQ